jgi:hypothetical protein
MLLSSLQVPQGFQMPTLEATTRHQSQLLLGTTSLDRLSKQSLVKVSSRLGSGKLTGSASNLPAMPTVWDHPDQEVAAVAGVAATPGSEGVGQLQTAMQVHRASGMSITLHRASGSTTAAGDSPRAVSGRVGARQPLARELRRATMDMPW